jgi:hypothetical protein
MKSIALIIAALLLQSAGLQAATYPVSGTWGYDSSPDPGGVNCEGRNTIAFAGDRRFETGGKAPPDYRNVSVERTGAASYRVVDRFFNGMQNGKVAYTLRVIDPDHIEIRHALGGATFRLRICN